MGENMKDNGKMINSMEWEKKYGIMEQKYILVNLERGKRMEKASSCGMMGHIMKGILKMACFRDMEFIILKIQRKHIMAHL
jgi:hypothetical protein